MQQSRELIELYAPIWCAEQDSTVRLVPTYTEDKL